MSIFAEDSSLTGDHEGLYFNSIDGAVGLVLGDSDRAVVVASAGVDFVRTFDVIPAQSFTGVTIGCIIQPTDVTGPSYILSCIDEGNGGVGFFIDGGTLKFFAGNAADGFASVESSTTAVNGTTYRMIGTWDGTTAKLYINGILETSEAWANPVALITDRHFYAGASDAANVSGTLQTPSFDGVIDEVFFAKTAISAGSVTTIDQAAIGTGSIYTAIRAISPYLYWRLGDFHNNPIVTLLDAVGITNTVTATEAIPELLYSTTLPDTCGDPSYDPTGRYVVFVEKLGSAYNLSRINRSGYNHVVLLTGSQPYADPAYSANGYYIVFSVQTAAPDMDHPYGKWALKYMHADGTRLITILDDGNANIHPTWATPTQIAFQNFRYGTDDSFQVSIIDLAGRGRTDYGDGEYPRVVIS